jgi:SagB-type dehydrogenase family enzyme
MSATLRPTTYAGADESPASATVIASALEVRPRAGFGAEMFPPTLRNGAVSLSDLESAAGQTAEAISTLHAQLGALADEQLISFAAGSGPDCVAELRPMAPGFRLRSLPRGPIVMSRFAHMRVENGTFMLETPLGVGAVRVLDASAVSVLGTLASPADAEILIESAARPDVMRAFLELLVSGGIVGPAGQGGRAELDEAPALQQWEAHDLLFHMRSRLGRHDHQTGGTFRFRGRLAPPPCVAQRRFRVTTAFRPPSRPLPLDPDLLSLLQRRASVREHAQLPITRRELGDFLYHSARVVEFVPGPDGPFTKRPYPNGGASYELEVYLVVDRCVGLAPGFYHYNPVEHGVASLTGPNDDTEALLSDAYMASGETCRPQVLLTIASRFPRVSWKYEGIAYATTLKNVGVLYGTMYLVATAMGLAPCALGAGNSERFSRLAGTDPYAESTVGEFMIGSAP